MNLLERVPNEIREISWYLGEAIPSTSMFLRELRKLVSDIMPLATVQFLSLWPLRTQMHSQTLWTSLQEAWQRS